MQHCEQGEHRWVEIPAAGKPANEPAPGVMLTPNKQELAMAIDRSIVAAVGVGLTLLPVAALAHAHLDHASPAIGSTVAQPPSEVSLWFTEALEAKFSTIEVRDAQGRPVQAGPATLARGNTAQLRVPLKALPPGTYKVIWRVLSVDTHRTQGDFTFRVGP